MIFKVLISLALVLVSIEARAFPGANGKSLEQLIDEFKNLEKGRHEALMKVQEKPEFKDDENIKQYLGTMAELDRVLVETRKALKDVPSLISTGGARDVQQSQQVLGRMKRLKQESETLKVRLEQEAETVPSSLSEDEDVQTLAVAFGVSGKKLLEIGLKMLMEIFASQQYEQRAYDPSVIMANNVH